jgi:hypothetical protein
MMDQQQPGLIQQAQESNAPKFDQGAEIGKMIEMMPDDMRQSFMQVVKAGKTILYSPETRQDIQDFLAQEAPIEEKLGMGIANLVIMIDNQANGNLPKEVMIPAATVLLFDAADVMRQAGEKITPEQMASAYEMMFYGIYAGYGMEPDQVDSVFGEMERMSSQPQQAQQPQQPGQVMQ